MRAVPFAILRHAPTVWNGEGRLQGLTDTALSVEGETAARNWCLPPPADGWKRVSSPLQRARRTAELVQPPAEVVLDSRLREMSFGVWEGFTVERLRATGGELFATAEAAGLDFHPPGGESPRMAMARLSRWSSSLGEPVVAVSHKAAIRALLALATGWNMLGRPPHKLDWKCAHFFVAVDEGRVRIDRLNVPLAGTS